MSQQAQSPIRIRMGGYGPSTTGFSRALKLVGDLITTAFGDRVDVKYVWNIMDIGYRAEDILWLVEDGFLTVGYQSSSYLVDRVPELGVVDLPFLFADNGEARAAMDGGLGRYLTEKTEAWMNYTIVGYFENGFRHLSNRLRPVPSPQDLAGMRIRVLPSDVHVRTFDLLGAIPMRMDLTEAITMIKSGEVDAQENPLSNTLTYGVADVHRFHTLTGHFYVSRPIFAHRPTLDGWPEDLRTAFVEAFREAVTFQRGDAEEAAVSARAKIEADGGEIIDLEAAERQAFVDAIKPQLDDAADTFGQDVLDLLRR